MNPHFGIQDFFGEFVIEVIGVVCIIYLIACIVKQIVNFVKRIRERAK